MKKVNEVIDVEVLTLADGREVLRPVGPDRVGVAIVLALFCGGLGVMGMGVVGLLDSDSVMAGLAALGVLGLAALKRSGKFSSIYLASMAIGVVGLILVAYLPGAWTIAGVPFLGFAAIATRGLEQRGWDRA